MGCITRSVWNWINLVVLICFVWGLGIVLSFRLIVYYPYSFTEAGLIFISSMIDFFFISYIYSLFTQCFRWQNITVYILWWCPVNKFDTLMQSKRAKLGWQRLVNDNKMLYVNGFILSTLTYWTQRKLTANLNFHKPSPLINI